MLSKRIGCADVVGLLAGKTGMTVEQVKALLKAQAELAYEHVDGGYSIPGIGVLGKTERGARKMVMRFGPKAGEEITIPAKRTLKFRVSKVAKDMVLGPPKPLPDLFKQYVPPDLKFSTDGTQLSDPSMFISALGNSLTLARDGKPASLVVKRLPDLWLPSGHIVAADFLMGGGNAFTRTVAPGRYPLALAAARIGTDERNAFAILRFSDTRVAKWEMAVTEGQDVSNLNKDQYFGYGVDSGTGSFCDTSVLPLIEELNDENMGFQEQIIQEMKNTRRVSVESPSGSVAVFSSGYGDGRYASYFGLDDAGNAAALVTDFNVVKWQPLNSH